MADSDGEISSNEELCHKFRSIVGQDPSIKKGKKKKSKAKDEKARLWRKHRDQFLEYAEDRMFEKDKATMKQLRTPFDLIKYADDVESANDLARKLLVAMDRDDRDYYIFGFTRI